MQTRVRLDKAEFPFRGGGKCWNGTICRRHPTHLDQCWLGSMCAFYSSAWPMDFLVTKNSSMLCLPPHFRCLTVSGTRTLCCSTHTACLSGWSACAIWPEREALSAYFALGWVRTYFAVLHPAGLQDGWMPGNKTRHHLSSRNSAQHHVRAPGRAGPV